MYDDLSKKILVIEDDLEFRLDHKFAFDLRPAGRQIDDLAGTFLAVGGNKQLARQIDADAPKAAPLGTRFGDHRLDVLYR